MHRELILRMGIILLPVLLLTAAACSPGRTGKTDARIVEAQEEAPFEILMPKKLPKGYSLANIDVSSTPLVGTVSVSLSYSGPAGPVPRGGLLIDQMERKGPLEKPTGGGDLLIDGVPAKTEISVTEVSVGGVTGFYTELKRDDGTVHGLQFVVDGIYVNLVSMEMSQEAMVEVAKSMLP